MKEIQGTAKINGVVCPAENNKIDGKEIKMNESNLTSYDVHMKTPIGIRPGHMTVCRDFDKVSGYLDILKHREPFEGTIDSDGNCKITGKIISLMRTINYEATGKITPDSLSLSLVDGRHILKITGMACCP